MAAVGWDLGVRLGKAEAEASKTNVQSSAVAAMTRAKVRVSAIMAIHAPWPESLPWPSKTAGSFFLPSSRLVLAEPPEPRLQLPY